MHRINIQCRGFLPGLKARASATSPKVKYHPSDITKAIKHGHLPGTFGFDQAVMLASRQRRQESHALRVRSQTLGRQYRSVGSWTDWHELADPALERELRRFAPSPFCKITKWQRGNSTLFELNPPSSHTNAQTVLVEAHMGSCIRLRRVL